MVSDIFEGLLQELGNSLKIEGLKPDKNQSCLIKFKNGSSVQLEMDKLGESLVIVSTIANVPPGRYRETVYREALRSNGLPDPRSGIFAYSKQADQLIYFYTLSAKNLTGVVVAEFLKPFMEKVVTWQEAIKRGDIPPISITYTPGTRKGVGMFGL